MFKVSYVLFQNCSIVLFMFGFLSFRNRKLTALLCLVCFLLFHSGVAERSFLGEERHHIYRLALCLVQIALKLDVFASPHSLGLNPVRVAPHLTSKLFQESRSAQALTSKCLSAWTIGVVYTSD